MPSLLIRVISAAVAIILVIATFHWFGFNGLKWFGLALLTVGVWEFRTIVLKEQPKALQALLIMLAALIIIVTVFLPKFSGTAVGVSVSMMWMMTLWLTRNNIKNEDLQNLCANTCLGLIHTALFPAFAIALLGTAQPGVWFFGLLAIVFSGDIFAYFGGITFGKRKLMPELSPKKTIAGFVSALSASMLCGALIGHYYQPQTPIGFWLATSFFVSVSAQSGDLFASLLKRVSGVKDSGSIMPGHGGVLDRLDGVYFGAPFMFLAANIYEQGILWM